MVHFGFELILPEFLPIGSQAKIDQWQRGVIKLGASIQVALAVISAAQGAIKLDFGFAEKASKAVRKRV